MQPSVEFRRLRNGLIDYDFYRMQAARRRRRVMRALVAGAWRTTLRAAQTSVSIMSTGLRAWLQAQYIRLTRRVRTATTI